MKKQISVLLVLMALLLLFGGIVPLQARAPRKVTGGIQVFNETTGELAFFSEYNVHEVGDGPEAKGWVQWRPPDPDKTGGWLPMIRVHAICVDFGEYEGHSAASYVVASPDYMDGTILKFWGLDGGTPGSEGDKIMRLPTPDQIDPNCDYEGPSSSDPPFLRAVGGNLVIRD